MHTFLAPPPCFCNLPCVFLSFALCVFVVCLVRVCRLAVMFLSLCEDAFLGLLVCVGWGVGVRGVGRGSAHAHHMLLQFFEHSVRQVTKGWVKQLYLHTLRPEHNVKPKQFQLMGHGDTPI